MSNIQKLEIEKVQRHPLDDTCLVVFFRLIEGEGLYDAFNIEYRDGHARCVCGRLQGLKIESVKCIAEGLTEIRFYLEAGPIRWL